MTSAVSPSNVGELRQRLADPREVCRALRLDGGARPQRGGIIISCPWHTERTPSCSVRVAGDGTIAVRCHGCAATGDVLTLVAGANGLDVRRDFREVLRLAAELAGGRIDEMPPWSPPVARIPDRAYPPIDEVAALWAACRPVMDDANVATWLRSRMLDPATVEDRDLGRALTPDGTPPLWARYRGRPWLETGYRLVVPMFDATGAMCSVRVRRVSGASETPKSLPPSGHLAGGLVMADPLARLIFAEGGAPDLWPAMRPLDLLVAEGEPDYLALATHYSDADETAPAVVGILSGAWTPAIADRIPDGASVAIWTDPDEAGNKYAEDIARTLADRCSVLRRRGQ